MSSSSSIGATTSSSGTTRVTGLYSSMDIDGMVSASLTNEQTKIDNASKDLQYAQWKKEAYEEINSEVKKFSNKYFSYSSKDSILSSTQFNAKKVTTSIQSSAISVTAGSGASVSEFRVLGCSKATYASKSTKTFTSEMQSLVGATRADGTVIKENNITMKELAEAIGTTLNAADGKFTLNINGTDVSISEDATISDFMSVVNNAKDSEGNLLGVKASYNGLTQKIEFATANTGKDAKLQISGNCGLFFGDKGLLGTDSVNLEGKNATLVVMDNEGSARTYESATNSITQAGFTFNITDDANFMEYDDEGNIVGGGMKVNMQTDVDAMAEKITNFVNDYNALVKKLSDTVTQKRDYDYDPLTDAEKKECSDDEIEELEAKAKEGILFGDSGIRNLLTNLRSTINSLETESGLSMRDIGIGTGNYFTTEFQGKLEIDEDKLKSALTGNMEEVRNLFTKGFTTTTINGVETKTGGGLAVNLDKFTDNFMDRMKETTLTSWEKRINSYEERLETLKEYFADKEDDLYSEFAYLETLLAQMDSSSSMFYQ